MNELCSVMLGIIFTFTFLALLEASFFRKIRTLKYLDNIKKEMNKENFSKLVLEV